MSMPLRCSSCDSMQTRRAAADDADLRFHELSSSDLCFPSENAGAAPSREWIDWTLSCTNRTCRDPPLKPAIQSLQPLRRDAATCPTSCIARRSPRARCCTTGNSRRTATRRLHQVLLDRARRRPGDAGRTNASTAARWTALNVPAGQVHGFTFKPGTQGWVVTLATEILDEALTAAGRASRRVLARSRRFPRHAADAPADAGDLRRITARANSPAPRCSRRLSALLLGFVARALGRREIASRRRRRIRSLREVREPARGPFPRALAGRRDYAAALADHADASEPAVAARPSGCPATHMIRDRIVREARRNLVYTNLPVSTIAYALGFRRSGLFQPHLCQRHGAVAKRIPRADLRGAMNSLQAKTTSAA